MLEKFIDNALKDEQAPFANQAKSQGAKVVHEAKNKAKRLLEDVDELLSQIQKPSP